MLSAEQLARLARHGEVRSVRPLVGGRGGRTFAVVHAGGATTVAHLRTHGVDAIEREAAATRAAHDAGAGPELLDVDAGLGLLVTRWVEGDVLAAGDLRDDASLKVTAAAVARLHRAARSPDIAALDPLGARTGDLEEARRRGVEWPAPVAQEQARTDALARDLDASAVSSGVLCHGDLVPANLVRGPGAVTVIDYEYAGLAEPAVDLGGLAAAAELDDAALDRLVRAYSDAGGTADRDRVRAWRDVLRHAWFVWVALGDGLGPERERWEAWATRASDRWSASA